MNFPYSDDNKRTLSFENCRSGGKTLRWYCAL